MRTAFTLFMQIVKQLVLVLILLVLILFLIGRGLFLFSTPAEDTIPENGAVISGREMLIPKTACQEMLRDTILPETDSLRAKVKNSWLLVKIRPGDLYRVTTMQGTPATAQKQLQEEAGMRFSDASLRLHPIFFWHYTGCSYEFLRE